MSTELVLLGDFCSGCRF